MKKFLRNVGSSPAKAPASMSGVATMDPSASGTQARQGVQLAPLLVGSDELEGRLMVDTVRRIGDRIVLVGWRTGPLQLEIRCNGERIEAREHAFPRPDVALNLGLQDDCRAGVALVTSPCAGDDLVLHWSLGEHGDGGSQPLLVDPGDAASADEPALGPLAGLLAHEYPFCSREWKRLVDKLPRAGSNCATAKAHIETACGFQGSGAFLLAGWVAARPGTLVWVEDEHGNCHPLEEGFRSLRADIHQAFGGELGAAALYSGLLLIGGTRDTRAVHVLSIKALTHEGVHLIAESGAVLQPGDPVSAARSLFGIGALNGDWPERVGRVDLPLLDSLIDRAQRDWPLLPVRVRDFGRLPAEPSASIIVPLYGRSDFVESQMLEWARDPWIREHAELVYVVDDPALVEPFWLEAEELHRLYGIPFRWVWGGVNRGFSGANNLGAAHANGEYLLFLNSDVFPQQPGWLQAMIEVLRTRPRAGAVAPRLLFAEGGIQHAGMRFERLEEFGVWINQHPNMGLDPALDPSRGPTSMPAVTGACMLLRRRDFDAVGQWDTGYLIGDFEDSDLCLKLRDAGLDIVYLPDVQLVHLERQSIASLGAGDFRTRVTLYNAVRHQLRWRTLIEQDAGTQAAQE